MSFSPTFSPAAAILKALGIDLTFVSRYSLHFSAEEVTVCRVEVVVCQEPLNDMQEQLKHYKVTLEPLDEDEPLEPSQPELKMIGAQLVEPIDLSAPPSSPSWGDAA